jgi:hypothetical protein
MRDAILWQTHSKNLLESSCHFTDIRGCLYDKVKLQIKKYKFSGGKFKNFQSALADLSFGINYRLK